MNASEAVQTVLTRWLDREPDLTPLQINLGQCERFAEDVIALLGGCCIEEGRFVHDGRLREAWVPGHVWVVFQGRNYDAERPGGVDDFRELPHYRRWVKKLVEDVGATEAASLVARLERYGRTSIRGSAGL
jgi:hypothetical protein